MQALISILFKSALAWLIMAATLSAAEHTSDKNTLQDSWRQLLLAAFHVRDVNDRPRLHHVGLVAEHNGEHWYVAAVLQGYPAQQAGLRRGDRLIAVNDRPFDPVTAFNPPAQQCAATLHFERGGEANRVALKPVYGNLFDALRSASEHSLNSFIIGNKRISYLQLWALSRNRDDLLHYQQLLRRVQASDALILDLRHAYGFFDWHHADAFFSSRQRLHPPSAKDGHDVPSIQITEDTLRPPHFEGSVVVISNAHTAGGAEQLMQQLRRSTRVMITGEASAGVSVDVPQDYPLTATGSIDAQFQTALDLLLNVL